ncbi:MAG: hypothetical protein A2036_02725 [Omnitrophica bacterium GWA2_50_21]|nr:MAG: hypothetical protein A2036_02725 [Omnitrophica bacterium GWA2_50_21]
MLKKTLKHLKGFTLVELLVVIAIIAVLSSIGVVSFRGARQRANDGKMQADIRTIQSAVELYFANENTGPGAGAAPADFDVLLTTLNVTQGLIPNGAAADGSGPAYCYYEDTNDTRTAGDPIYVIAAVGFSRDMGTIGFNTDIAVAAYETKLSAPATAVTNTGIGVCETEINCDGSGTPDIGGETICLGN